MSPTMVTTHAEEAGLKAFLDPLPGDCVAAVRTLAHAWAAVGGKLAPGRLAVRLLGPETSERPAFTAATLYAPRGDHANPRLELARTILEHHGVGPDAFEHWCDEIVDLGGPGFSARAKFPAIPLPPSLSAGDLARLVGALRDLALMTGA